MTGFDFTVLGILIGSGLLGLIRGLLKEVLSLAAYALALIAAIYWSPTVYDGLKNFITTPMLRLGIAYAAVFFITLFGVGIINISLAAIIRHTGLTPADHGLGGLFGLARGGLIILILITLLGYTPLIYESWWREAMFSSPIVETLKWVKTCLPPSLSTYLPYK